MIAKTPLGNKPSRGRRPATRELARAQRILAARSRETRQRRRNLVVWGGVFTVVIALVAMMMWTSRTTTDTTSRPAPDFTLSDTNGATVRLADYRGKNLVLYFNEGAGCQSCLFQMVDIERNADDFAADNITVLPIVMNTAEQIRADMATNGVSTPFLIDADGSVSAAYGTLGKGMHAGLPGHSFVLIDSEGVQRWYGEYPSMYLSSADLLEQVRKRLA